jgi:hypothetical protein
MLDSPSFRTYFFPLTVRVVIIRSEVPAFDLSALMTFTVQFHDLLFAPSRIDVILCHTPWPLQLLCQKHSHSVQHEVVN